jgi:hypothetical protein
MGRYRGAWNPKNLVDSTYEKKRKLAGRTSFLAIFQNHGILSIIVNAKQ